MQVDIHELLKTSGLRDTQSRRLVLEALATSSKPISQKEIHLWITKNGSTTNLVTVYRIVEALEKLSIVHRHPSSGGFVLCTMQEEGHHGFLSCQECGMVEEFSDPSLCKEEDRIARKAGFTPKHHVSEIIGCCADCQ